MARVAVDRLDDLPGARAVPPVVPDDLRVRMRRRSTPSAACAAGVVAAVAVDEQEAAEALPVQRVEQVADDRLVGLDAQRRAAGVGGEVRRDPVRERRHAPARRAAPRPRPRRARRGSCRRRARGSRAARSSRAAARSDRLPRRYSSSCIQLQSCTLMHRPPRRRAPPRAGARPCRPRRRAAARRAGFPRRARTAATPPGSPARLYGLGVAALDVALGRAERRILRRRRIRDRRPGEHGRPARRPLRSRPRSARGRRARRDTRRRRCPRRARAAHACPGRSRRPAARSRCAVDVPRLPEDDRAERVVDEVELGDVDVDELEAGRAEPLDRLLEHAVAHGRHEVGVVELAAAGRRRAAPSTGRSSYRRAREHAEERRRLRDRARERADVVARLREREHAVDRDEAERRLEADDAAVRGRDPDRAAGVGAEREVAHARRDERGRAAARAARRAALVARVERHPVGRVDAPGRVLEQVRLAQELGARIAQARDDRRVARRPAAGRRRWRRSSSRRRARRCCPSPRPARRAAARRRLARPAAARVITAFRRGPHSSRRAYAASSSRFADLADAASVLDLVDQLERSLQQAALRGPRGSPSRPSACAPRDRGRCPSASSPSAG